MYVCYNLIKNLKSKHTYFYFDDSSWSFFALESFELLLQDHTRNLYQCCYCCCSRLSKSHLYVRQSMLEGHRDKTGDQLLFVRRSKKSESSRVKILRLKKKKIQNKYSKNDEKDNNSVEIEKILDDKLYFHNVNIFLLTFKRIRSIDHFS